MENNNNNVIKFPKSRIKNRLNIEEQKPQSEDMNANILDMKISHINESLFLILPKLFQNIDMAGGTTEFAEDIDDEYKNINFIVESIRSLLYKRYEMEHPFQNLAEEIFVVTDDGSINIKDKLEIEFNNQKKTDDIS